MSSGITSKDLHKPLSERVARNLSDRKYSDSSKNIYGIEDNSYTPDGDAPDATIIDTLLPLNINDQNTLDGSDAAEYVPLDGDKIKGSHDNILSRLQDVDEVKRKIRVRKRKGSKFVEMTDTSGKDENNFHKLECGEHTVTKMGDQSLSSERHLSCDQVNKVELNVFRIPYNESDKTHLSVGNEVSTQEEANGPEKLCIDDIHLPFEEDVQTPTNHDSSLTCKQNTGVAEHPLHIEDLHLPFDEVDDELRNSVSKAQTALGLLKLGNASADSSMNDTSMSDVNLEAVKMKRKSVGRRRSRRSADFEIINENVVEISPDVALPDVSSARRSKRLKRKSIEIYRSQHKKKIQPESPDSNDSMNTSSEDAAGQKDRDEKISLNFENEHIENENKDKGSTDITLSEHCVNMETIVEDQGGTQFVSVAVSHDEPCHDKPLEKTSEELSELSRTPRKRKCALKPKDNLDKPVRKGKKRKVGPSIEDIYLNKLWKSQMPMEHPWETIYEEPKVLGKGGREEYQSHKRMKRALIPEEFYTQTKLKKRRQKAIKHGWKPLSKKRLDKAGQLLEEKLSALDKDIITLDSNCDKDETVASCKNDTKDDGETCTGNVSISTFGMGQSFEHSHIKTGENNDVVVKEYEVFNCQKFDTSSSQSSRY